MIGVLSFILVILVGSTEAQKLVKSEKRSEGGGPFEAIGGITEILRKQLSPLGAIFAGPRFKEEEKVLKIKEKIKGDDVLLEESLLSESKEIDFKDMIYKPGKFFGIILEKIKIEEKIEFMTKAMFAGIELALKPINIFFKSIEGVIQPTGCHLRDICIITTKFNFIRYPFTKLSSEVLEESLLLKAASKGILGSKCEELFVCGSSIKIENSGLNNIKKLKGSEVISKGPVVIEKVNEKGPY